MTLTDTGPLVALLDKDDAHNLRCVEAAKKLAPGPLLTTWPCFTEAMYLLGSVGGYRYQSALWNLRQAHSLYLQDLTSADLDRMMTLMAKYQDQPMDLADASLVAVAEKHDIRQLFTLDRDFFVYRLRDGSALEVVPR